MKNLTITVDEELARWARVAAAKNEQSVSRFVSEMLRERMELEAGYGAAMKRSLRRKPKPLKKSGRYPRREELYDRPVLRR